MRSLVAFLSCLSLSAFAENINISFTFSPAGCAAPPVAFGLSFVPASSIAWRDFTYSKMTPVPPNIPLASPSSTDITPGGSDGTCAGPPWTLPGWVFVPRGGAHTFTAPTVTFGSGGGAKYVGVKAWVHGGATMSVTMTTSARTVTVGSTQARWEGSSHPFVIANDKKFIYGYTSWPGGGCGVGEGVYYKVVDLNPGESVISFTGQSAVSNNAACGGGVFGMQGSFKIDSGLRVQHNGSTIPISAEPPPVLTSPLRIRKNGTDLGLRLVDPSDTNASPVRITTPGGMKALEKYVP